MRIIFTIAALLAASSIAHSEPASFLGAQCGATIKQLKELGATLVDNTPANRSLVDAQLDPVYSVAGTGPAGIEVKLATRLPIFPSEFRFAELLFKDGQLIRMAVFFKVTDDTAKGQNAKALMDRITRELLAKYAMVGRYTDDVSFMGVARRGEQWRHDGDAGSIVVGYVFRATEPLPKTEVMTRIDFSQKCHSL